jgi:entry exclusion lipoprotein TrbK
MKSNSTHVHVLASAALAAILFAGCDHRPDTPQETPKAVEMPQVNDENCKPENIGKVDTSIRQKFADACFRRGSPKPSSGKTY